MNDLRNLAAFTLLVPLALGCAGRTAPFNEMDKAQITVLRLSPPPPPAPAVGQPGGLIPGIPPELQQMGQQILQGAQQVLPPGLIPPGLIPGQPAGPQQPPPPMWKGYAITAQQPLVDDKLKEEILDIFGSEDSFSGQRGNCFMPGMGVSMARPTGGAPVDLLISLSCNQAQGDGFAWPYPGKAGFTSDAHERLSKVYQSLWGPVPPGA